MADDRLQDARHDARAAIERYDSLDRSQRMNDKILKERAVEIHGALESLVAATNRRFSDDVPERLQATSESAKRALDEFDDPTQYDHAQHVRRACYVLRKEARSLLGELNEVNA